jgi:branched-chain amino acid transport system substrate-binding protein
MPRPRRRPTTAATSAGLGLLALLLGPVLSACGGTGGAPAPGAVTAAPGSCTHHDLALLGEEGGPASGLGASMLGGVRLALQRYDAAHPGCPVGLRRFDTQGDPSQASALAVGLAQDLTVVGVVGPGLSAEALSSGAVLAGAQMPSISPSATGDAVTRQGWTSWHRLVGTDADQGAADATFLAGRSHRIYLLDDGTDHGAAITVAVRHGLPATSVVGSGRASSSRPLAPVGQVVASGATALFYGDCGTSAGALLRRLRGAGWTGTFVCGSGDGGQSSAFLAAAGAKAAQGALVSSPAGPPPASFATAYRRVVGHPAGLYAAQAYDAASILLSGVAAGATAHSAMNSFIDSYTGRGASGAIAFDAAGDLSSPSTYLLTVADGRLDTAHPRALS